MGKKTLFRGLFVIFLALISFRIVEVVRADSFDDYIDRIAPNGKMVINSVKPSSISEALSYITYNLNSMTESGTPNYRYSGIGKDTTDDTNVEGIYEMTFCEYIISNGVKICDQNKERRVVNVEVIFDDSKKDNTIQEKVSNYIENFEKGKQYHIWNNDPYEILVQIEDMELLSYLTKFDGGYNALMDLKGIFGLLRYNSTFRDITQNMNFAHSWNAAGNGCDINTSLRSDLLFEYDGFIYGRANSYIREFILNAIYIDENVGNDNNSIMAAVQKRLDDNLGKNVAIISLAESDDINPLIDEVIEDYATPYGIQIDKTKMVNQLFNITIGGFDYKFIVIKDSSKIKNLSNVKTVDFKTLSSIIFNSKYISADALIDIVINNDNSTILNTLKLDSGITYDIGLFSQMLRSYIDKLDTGKFVVSVPISNQMLNKKLYAYYIKKDGSVEKHDVTIKDGFAEFETDHFSTYTIGEASEADLQISNIKNGDIELQLKNNKYVLNNINNTYLDINYELVNIDENKQYVVGIKYENGFFDYRNYTSGVTGNYITTPIDKNITSYRLMVCDTDICDTIYDDIEIEIDYQIPEFLNNVSVTASNIKQANILLSGTHYDRNEFASFHGYFEDDTTVYNVNRNQIISVYLKAENLVEEDEYTVLENWITNCAKYTGRELMDGVVLSLYGSYMAWDDALNFNLYKNNVLISRITLANGDGIFFLPSVEYDDNLFTYQFSYKNYKNINIVEDGYVFKYFILNRNYLNKNNPLDIDIKATSEYENQDYNLLVEIRKDNKIIYTKEETVNGLLLNSGYTITLNDLELEYAKEMLDDISYNVDVAIDYVGIRKAIKYNSLGYAGLLYSKIYYKKGQQNLTTARGGGGPLFTSFYYSINNSLFSIYPEIYLKVQGEHYVDNELYDYKLEYGNFVNGYGIFEETLKTGKISGRVLNTIGIYLPVDNHKNYKNFQYRFVISKGDEVIYAVAPTINQFNSETLSSARLVAKHRDLYLVTSYDPMITPYIATRNAPIDIIVSGLGFKDDEEYEFTVDYGYYNNDDTNDYSSIFTNHNPEDFAYEYQENVTFSGKDINEGKAQIINKIKTNNNYTGAYITITSSKGWGAIYVKFVDCRDLFKTFKKYTLDNTEDIIKRISKKTSIENFISNIEIVNNGTIKVFDTTGENEITNQIGTGMITRILNEYDENLLDLDVVVTGDISGDGNISVTDLAKIERYLAKLTELDGVYKMAADVNGNDSITLTDLVKISRDIARLEEIQ